MRVCVQLREHKTRQNGVSSHSLGTVSILCLEGGCSRSSLRPALNQPGWEEPLATEVKARAGPAAARAPAAVRPPLWPAGFDCPRLLSDQGAKSRAGLARAGSAGEPPSAEAGQMLKVSRAGSGTLGRKS